jgi:hypothetical protein
LPSWRSSERWLGEQRIGAKLGVDSAATTPGYRGRNTHGVRRAADGGDELASPPPQAVAPASLNFAPLSSAANCQVPSPPPPLPQALSERALPLVMEGVEIGDEDVQDDAKEKKKAPLQPGLSRPPTANPNRREQHRRGHGVQRERQHIRPNGERYDEKQSADPE